MESGQAPGGQEPGRLAAGAVVPLPILPGAAEKPPWGQVLVRAARLARPEGAAALGRVAAIGEGVDPRLLGGLVLLPPRRPGAPRPPLRRAEEVHLLPEDLHGLDPDLAEDLALARRAVRRGRVDKGERVRVFGAGRVAQMIARVAAVEGAALVGRPPADVIFTAEGRPADIAAAIRAAGPGCRLVLLPLQAPLPPLDLAGFLARETDLIGCGLPGTEDYEAALALLAFRDVARE